MEPAWNNVLQVTLSIFLLFLCVNDAIFLAQSVLCLLRAVLLVKNLTFLTKIPKHVSKDVLSQQ